MKNQRKPRALGRLTLNHLIALLAALIFTYPVLWILMASIKPDVEIYREPLRLFPSRIDISIFQRIFETQPIMSYLCNSLLYSVGAVVISLSFALFASYGLSRHEFKAKQPILIIILMVQMIPALVSIIPIYLLMQRMGLYDTRLGMVILYSALRIPWGVWILVGFIDQIPKALDEAAIVDGASKLRVLTQIIFPLALPGLASAAIFTFVGTWNEFAIASIVLRSPQNISMPVGSMAMIAGDVSDWRMVAAMATVNLLPILVVFALLQRHIIAGLTRGAVKE